jgi:hypothetical protein
LAALLLLLSLSACGNKRSMEAARSDDEMLGNVHDEASVTKLEGQEDVSFDEKAARHEKVSHLKHGNTRSGGGRLNEVKVRPGDTLWKIAERKDVYGSGWLYPLIYKANRDKIRNPAQLDAGVVLKVPRDVPDPDVEIAEEEAMTGQILDGSPLPGAQPTPVPVAPPAPAAQGGGHAWLWTILALLAAGGGTFAWKRRRPASQTAA